MYVMVGIMMTMGHTKKVRLRKHWSTAQCFNYPLVRKCIQRDLFELPPLPIHSHCSDGSAPPRVVLPNGEANPAFDSKHHIRREGLRNTTRQVLWVFLGASPVLSEKLKGSGVYIAMDNYLTSLTLFDCLSSHIFAVGTCRSYRT